MTFPLPVNEDVSFGFSGPVPLNVPPNEPSGPKYVNVALIWLPTLVLTRRAAP